MFIAVVGIAAGPSFVAGFKDVGFSLFIVGALATAIPLVSGLLMANICSSSTLPYPWVARREHERQPLHWEPFRMQWKAILRLWDIP